jgi:hypothetical protein
MERELGVAGTTGMPKRAAPPQSAEARTATDQGRRANWLGGRQRNWFR